MSLALRVGAAAVWDGRLPAFLEKALALAEPESVQAGRLLAHLGSYVAAFDGDDLRAQQCFARAEAIIALAGDREAELTLRVYRGLLHNFYLRFNSMLEDELRAIVLARELGDPTLEAGAHFCAAVALLATGDLDRARVDANACWELALRLRDQAQLANATYAQALCALTSGDWEAAGSALDRGLAFSPFEPRLLSSAGLMHLELGEREECGPFRDGLLDLMRMTPDEPVATTCGAVLLSQEALLTGDLRRSDVADEAARAVLAQVPSPLGVIQVRTVIALLAVLRADEATAALQYAALERFRGTNPTHGTFPTRCFDDLLGLFALTTGRLDDAIGHFEAAVAFCRRGHRPAFAWAAYDCAGTLLRRGDAGDRERARGLLDESLGLARELRMKPLLEKALALKMQSHGVSGSDPFTSIVAVSTAVLRERPDVSLPGAADGTVTIMFTDIENSTALTERLGDANWMELLRDHNAIVEREVKALGGRVVKNRGDGFMLAFADHGRALDCAVALQRAFRGNEVVRVRIGLHAGNPVREGDDFFGTDVNFAARVADRAAGGQVLVSERVRDLLAGKKPERFGEATELELKGLAGTHRVFAVIGI